MEKMEKIYWYGRESKEKSWSANKNQWKGMERQI